MTKVIAFIPARAGSKRLPNKNKKLLLGSPLICWTIEQALECDFIDQVIVSTDDTDILKICTQYFEEYQSRIIVSLRPKELAQDDTKIEEVLLDYFKDFRLHTKIILLQPTSPLRVSRDIELAYEFFVNTYAYGLYSVYKEDDLHFKLNGAIYIFPLYHIQNGNKISDGTFRLLYIMPKERSIDIDTQEDFDQCEQYLNKLYK